MSLRSPRVGTVSPPPCTTQNPVDLMPPFLQSSCWHPPRVQCRTRSTLWPLLHSPRVAQFPPPCLAGGERCQHKDCEEVFRTFIEWVEELQTGRKAFLPIKMVVVEAGVVEELVGK
eukprot:2174831-Pyramimonas_sp.AAC.2